MKNTNGFTLLELLIAAMLVAVLAMFATLAFRQTSSDIRLQDAKNRADYIAVAMQRFWMDNSGSLASQDYILSNPATPAVPANCDASIVFPTSVGSLQNLVDCGYLEYRAYLDANFTFQYKYQGGSTPALICVCGASGKLSAKYKCSEGYSYCTDGENHTEQFGS
ncbi:MAG: prepilin-type N-terminal cleavage/methylation domain-containing protein [Elusimicrobiaceae bacterium]|nr:prepilin-type N-terminal cleavage/methylation domain-containing protein [Elusimicrobiaceae bacterium]